MVVLLAVAMPWYALLLSNVPGVTTIWYNEITRIDPADPRPDPWYNALRFFLLFLPWTPWLIVGIGGARPIVRRERRPMEMALWLFVVPFLIFSCFSERQPRYLQPLITPAAVLAGWAMVEQFKQVLCGAADWSRLAARGALDRLGGVVDRPAGVRPDLGPHGGRAAVIRW